MKKGRKEERKVMRSRDSRRKKRIVKIKRRELGKIIKKEVQRSEEKRKEGCVRQLEEGKERGRGRKRR